MLKSQQPHMVFVHGWGQSPHIWFQQYLYFNSMANIHCITLPGHNGSINLAADDWLAWIEHHIHQTVGTHPYILIGWSLGSEIVLSLALALQHRTCYGMALISATPCFRQRSNWPWGCASEVWDNFTQAAHAADPKLMQRFFHLMLHGDVINRQQRNHILRQTMDKQIPPHRDGLLAGLSHLSDIDVRKHLSEIHTNTLVIHGEHDAIVPWQAGSFIAENIRNAQWHMISDCGHAPFLTHDADFNQILEQWWKSL